MTNKELKISYQEFGSIEELPQEDKELAQKAVDATRFSYAPYSKFDVGAALLLSDGRVFTGANQENAAYPSGLCAERTTMFYAHAHADGAYFSKIAVAASQGGVLLDSPASPCGDCRQVMAEFQTKSGHPLEILLVGKKKVLKFERVECILPFIFDSL
ncbi:MAG: cytidine deaminase [Bacteroidales bacterium]|nr:cytidine deaminase [Candidatus Cryptobacteroides caccocaballi]